MGPDEKGVAAGSFVGVGEAVLIGAQKATIAEQRICSEGYDVSSRIVNGMSRTVDVLEVIRLWGDADSSMLVEAVEGCNSHRIAARKKKSLVVRVMLLS
jgi:hypothetical protein